MAAASDRLLLPRRTFVLDAHGCPPFTFRCRKTIDACSDLQVNCRQLGAGALPRAPGSVEKLKLGERAKGEPRRQSKRRTWLYPVRTDRERPEPCRFPGSFCCAPDSFGIRDPRRAARFYLRRVCSALFRSAGLDSSVALRGGYFSDALWCNRDGLRRAPLAGPAVLPPQRRWSCGDPPVSVRVSVLSPALCTRFPRQTYIESLKFKTTRDKYVANMTDNTSYHRRKPQGMVARSRYRNTIYSLAFIWWLPCSSGPFQRSPWNDRTASRHSKAESLERRKTQPCPVPSHQFLFCGCLLLQGSMRPAWLLHIMLTAVHPNLSGSFH
jgi:hypothetical protein